MNEEFDKVQKNNDGLLSQIVFRYLPFWPVFVLVATITLVVSILMLRSQTKIYVASSKVLLKDPQKGGGDSKVLEALNIFSEKKIVENELVVLRSTSLMEEVVRDLDLYTSVYNEGRVQIEGLYGEMSPLYFIAENKDSITSDGKHYFQIDWKNNQVIIDDKKVLFGGVLKMGKTNYRLEPNKNYNKGLIGKNYFVVFNSIKSTASSIIGSIKAAPISYASTVIDVKMETPIPQKGIDILNKLFEVYNKAGIDDKNLIATKTLNFIEDRLNTVINQLDSVEKNIEQFKSKEGGLELGTQATTFFENVKELDKANSTLDLQLQLLKDVSIYINSKGKKTGTVPSLILLNDETLRVLLNQLYTAEFELDQVNASSGKQSNVVLLAAEKIEKLKGSIRESIGNLQGNLLTQKRINEQNIGMNKRMYTSIPKKERTLIEISRQQAIKNNIYTYLLQKREETALSSASTSADLRVLERGSFSGPISPIASTYYWAGFLIGLIIFILYVQLYEQLNNRIMFRAEIEKKTNVPVIGEIVQSKNNETIAITEGVRTVIAEQFRALRTNLNFMGFNDKDNVLLVTSSISGEGKSFV